MFLRLAASAVLIYLFVTLLLFIFQRRLLYYPDTSTPAAPTLKQHGVAFWPDDGDRYRGFIGTAGPEPRRGTIIVFHGNAGAAWQRNYYIHALQPLGYRVILAEYPGYGGRPGTPSETVLTADARETVRLARRQFGGPLFVWGESLGAGIAAAAIGGSDIAIDGVALITPWDSLENLAQTHYPYVPARWLIKDRYDSVDHLSDYHGPVALVIAEEDRIVPNRHSLRLYASLKPPKHLIKLDDAGHNNWPISPHAPWWGQAMAFLSEHGKPSAPTPSR